MMRLSIADKVLGDFAADDVNLLFWQKHTRYIADAISLIFKAGLCLYCSFD